MASVWIITEERDDGTAHEEIVAVCATADKAVDWLRRRCGCDLRHDLFQANPPQTLLIGMTDLVKKIEEHRQNWREWRDTFCAKPRDVEEWEVES